MACGEVALLDDIPRTATVTCRTDVDVLAVGRDDFLEAVTGHPHSMERARDVTMSYRSQTIATGSPETPTSGWWTSERLVRDTPLGLRRSRLFTVA
jgi:hypothetical protein